MTYQKNKEWNNLGTEQTCLEKQLHDIEVELRTLHRERKKEYKNLIWRFICMIFVFVAIQWISSDSARELSFGSLMYALAIVGIPCSIFVFAKSFVYFLAHSGLPTFAKILYGDKLKDKVNYFLQKKVLEQQIASTLIKLDVIRIKKEEMEESLETSNDISAPSGL